MEGVEGATQLEKAQSILISLRLFERLRTRRHGLNNRLVLRLPIPLVEQIAQAQFAHALHGEHRHVEAVLSRVSDGGLASARLALDHPDFAAAENLLVVAEQMLLNTIARS